jgi:type VI secretion system secreted protein VgrG
MGATFVQGNTSLFSLSTPLGADKLLLARFRGSEGISRLFRFELDLLSQDPTIDYTQIIGKSVTITLNQAGGTPRYFSGVISSFGQTGSGNVFTSYHAEMVPWLWFLTRTANCRIFQNKTIPDIITQVFQDSGHNDFKNSLSGSYTSREYCVQYRESDFNFVSRLMEEYGIFYFFEHQQDKHILVLADASGATTNCSGQSQFRFDAESTAEVDEDVITGWRADQELRTGKYSLADYNFETPATNLQVSASTLDSVGGNSSMETFDYPGKFLTTDEGDSSAKLRMEEQESVHMVMRGTSNARSMASGYQFSLTQHYRDSMNTAYLLTDVEHTGHTGTYGTSRSLEGDRYSNSFRCIPVSVPYRPLRLTPRPFIRGPQPAVVVGKSGEEIWVDEYGRVKVQFFWDRKGSKDENSSCWVRVAQFWAGKNWGAIFTPRIGQEVLVDFLEGDPDQPLVTGRVYNADQMPPYTLPDNMTQSTIKTRSSKGGTTDNFNEIKFEDKKGSELLLIHAEKDMTREVENDDSLTVGHDQTITIKNDRNETVEQGNETVEIKQGNRSHTITTGNETLTVKTGNRLVEVDQGNDTHQIKMGNRNVEISMGNDSLKISLGNQTTKLDLGASSTEAMQSITLKVGQNSITIDQMGVTIQGMMIKVQGQVETQIQGTITQVSGDAMLTCKGGITMIN